MSDRGSVIIDERTNTVILTDVPDKIAAFKRYAKPNRYSRKTSAH